MPKASIWVFALAIQTLSDGGVQAQNDEVYFADEVVHQSEEVLNASNALGRNDGKRATLGCGGSITLRFSDNVLIEGPGDDLFVVERGRHAEATDLEISTDGQKWVSVGTVQGSQTSVDISPVAAPRDVFSFIRLTDRKEACQSRHPGADIDAVRAVGASLLQLEGDPVFFQFDDDQLSEQGKASLAKAVARMDVRYLRRIIVNGHTDAIGAPAYNQALSERRAEAVGRFLQQSLGLSEDQIFWKGYGERNPRIPNADSGRTPKNRRVEIFVEALHPASE